MDPAETEEQKKKKVVARSYYCGSTLQSGPSQGYNLVGMQAWGRHGRPPPENDFAIERALSSARL